MFNREKTDTPAERPERPSGIFTRLNDRNEDGQVSTKMTLVGGFGLIALTATLWITSTAAGSGADTANCISDMTVGCSDRNARVADASRQNLAGGYVSNFGSQNGGSGGVSRDEALTNGNNKVTKEDLPGVLENIKRIMDLPMASRPYSQDWLFYDSNNVYSNPDATRDEMVAALRRQISNSEKNIANYRFPFASDQELNKMEELLNATGSNTVYSRTDSKGNVYKYSVSDLMRDHVSASKQNEAIRAAQDLVNRSGPMTAAQFKKEFGDLQKRYLVIGGEAGVWKTAYNNMDAFGKSI